MSACNVTRQQRCYQTEIAFHRDDKLYRLFCVSKHLAKAVHMAQDNGSHVVMPRDARVVDAHDLGDHPHDIFRIMDQVEEWRMSQDIVYRLFTNDDETELTQHVLGIIAAKDTTVQPGLLSQQYATQLTGRAWSVLGNIQFEDALPFMAEDNVRRRTQKHFVLLVAMAIENEFCQYITTRCYSRDRLRDFIHNTIQPALSRFLQGEMTGSHNLPTQNSSFGVEEFVNHARINYISLCCPQPVYTVAPARVPT